MKNGIVRAPAMASLLFITACNTTTAGVSTSGTVGALSADKTPVIQRGEASWYGPGFHGHRTASGENFNAKAMTAAHRSLPFGSKVRVTNESNGSSVVVRINDRGPYAHGRVIDLAKGAAQVLGLMESGTAYVSLQQVN